MARYYCDYCDARCSNNSASVRTQHNSGNLHRRNVSAYYSQFIGKDVQDKIDAIIATFDAKVARGEVIPTYATFPRPAPVPSAERTNRSKKTEDTAQDSTVNVKSDERSAQKRPRTEAGADDEAISTEGTDIPAEPSGEPSAKALEQEPGGDENDAIPESGPAWKRLKQNSDDTGDGLTADDPAEAKDEIKLLDTPKNDTRRNSPSIEPESVDPAVAGEKTPVAVNVSSSDQQDNDNDGSDMELEG